MTVECRSVRYETVETAPVDGWRTYEFTGRVWLSLYVNHRTYEVEAQEVGRAGYPSRPA